MTCTEFLEFIERYTPDTTTRADQMAAFRHSRSCDPCRVVLAERSALGKAAMTPEEIRASIDLGKRQAFAIVADPECR